MQADMVFQAATYAAMLGWLALLASPFIARAADLVATIVIPALIGVAYTGLVLAYFAGAEGGFDTLDNVALLFQTREMLLAGWLHYLAFDLFVGAWIVRAARAAGIHFLLVVPCLAATFLFGPAGYLAFLVLRAALKPRSALATA